MNDVRLVQAAVQPAVSAASSRGTEPAKPKVDGNTLPDKVSNPDAAQAPKAQKVSAEALQHEVAKVNTYVQTVQRDLQFSVDEDLDRTVIRVVDSDSGEVIRQIPDDIFLELARRLKEDGEMNLLNALG